MAMEPIPLGFGDGMDATLFSSLWAFQDEVQQPQESVEELKQSLLAATMELEASKEELRRKEQTIAKLADLVRQVAKERDDALDQAQQLVLLAKQAAPPAHPPQPPAMVTSSVTDSDCSLVSSPVDPFFDPVTSSDRRRCGGNGKLSPPPPAKQQQQRSRSYGQGARAMARLLLPQCCCGGLTPLPLPRRATALPPPPAAGSSRRALSLALPAGAAASRRALSLRVAVAAPTRLVTAEDDGSQAAPSQDDPSEFDPAAPPPFGLAEIRAAIPKHCWAKDPWRSMGYVVRDVVVVLALAAAAARLDSWLAWPVYWAAQGTMFWALFVLGHDCGHGSFSNNVKLNSVVGHILHSSILVPYNGWRISHRTHHQNHGHVENDESWHPLPEKLYRSLDSLTRKLRFALPFPMLAYPFYLWSRSPGKSGSHFHPSSDLFQPNEKKDILTSTTCWLAMAGLLAGLTVVMGPLQMLKLYGVPYWIFVMWLDFVTYLHHHGHNDKLPWYRGKAWSYLRGGLTTLDRDYGWLNNIHHDIGTHVIHHLFPQIPHYHLVEATEAAKPVLGKYYKEPDRSGPFPFHLFGVLARSLKCDHYVSDTGDILYYQTDPKIAGGAQTSD